MPKRKYTFDTLADIPDSVPKEKRTKQWIEIWNDAYDKARRDGKSEDEAASSAFAQATSATKPKGKEAAMDDLDETGALKDADTKKPYGDVEYADPGYQEDKKKRYPIDTEAHIRAAWNYINKEKNAGQYTADQVKKIKARIVAAWKAKIDKDGPPLAAKAAGMLDTALKSLEAVHSSLGFKSVFVPICKIVENKDGSVTVRGTLAVEEPDIVNEIWDYETSKPYMLKWNTFFNEHTEGVSQGNLRAMHRPVSAGMFTEMAYDDERKAVDVVALVNDKDECKKVKARNYTGFSIGAKYVKKWKDPVRNFLTRWTGDPFEGSLADMPAMPSATLKSVDAGGVEGTYKFASALPVEIAEKDLSEIQTFSRVLQDMYYLRNSLIYEQQQEKDDPKNVQGFIDLLKTLTELFGAYCKEQVDELVSGRAREAPDLVQAETKAAMAAPEEEDEMTEELKQAFSSLTETIHELAGKGEPQVAEKAKGKFKTAVAKIIRAHKNLGTALGEAHKAHKALAAHHDKLGTTIGKCATCKEAAGGSHKDAVATHKGMGEALETASDHHEIIGDNIGDLSSEPQSGNEGAEKVASAELAEKITGIEQVVTELAKTTIALLGEPAPSSVAVNEHGSSTAAKAADTNLVPADHPTAEKVAALAKDNKVADAIAMSHRMPRHWKEDYAARARTV